MAAHPDDCSPPTDRAQRRRQLLLGLALLVMTLLAYTPAIRDGGFIWDDNDYVQENQTLRDLNGLKDIWLTPQATPQYYPLVHTGYWIEYQLWGLDPTGYHVTNVLLHALAAVLLWRLLRYLAVPGAWLAAALFALHPVHVESVAWITERKNVLSGVFYLAAALAYLKWTDARTDGQRRPRAYLAALLLFVCALLSKTVTCSLPAALLLVLWWRDGRSHDLPPRRWIGERILPLLPFFAIGLAFSAITVWLEKHHVGAKGIDWELSFVDRCLIAGRALWFYIGKLAWPANLCFSYPRWDIDAGSWWQYLYPAAFAALLALLWAARRRLGRGPLVALLFFAGSLFPALGFFDVYPMRYSFVADHFNYLASIGILVLAAAAMARASSKLTAAARAAAPALVLAPLALASASQCRIYQGLESLWLDTIKKNPASWMAYNNLGQLRVSQQRFDEAAPLLAESLRLNPREVTAINNLGAAMAGLGRVEEAEKLYQRAIEVDPADPQAYNNLGATMAGQGNLERAIALYRKSLALDASLHATHINLAISLAESGHLEEAIPHFQKAIDLRPDFAMAHLNFAEKLHQARRLREAADQYRQALKLDPSLAAAHNYLGAIAVSDQLIPLALEHFHKAVEADPANAQFRRNLAKVLAAQGQLAVAGEYYRRAAMLARDDGMIHMDYADFLQQHGDKASAVAEYHTAAKLLPNDPNPLFQAALLEQQLGKVDAAIETLKAVIRMDPSYIRAYNHLAVSLAGQNRDQDAIEWLQKAVSIDPNNAELHNNLGVMLARTGNPAQAISALEQAVRLNPGYSEAIRNLEGLRRSMTPAPKP